MVLDSSFKKRTIRAAIRKTKKLVAEITGDEDSAKLVAPRLKETMRLSSIAGRSIGGHTIELNIRILLNEEDFTNTLYHELAHLICFHCYGKGRTHGKEWKEVMNKLGVPPDRTHQIDLAAIMPDRWKALVCKGCGQRVIVSKRIRSKLRNEGIKYSCRLCGGEVKI